MEWYSNLTNRQVIIVRFLFGIFGFFGLFIGGFYLALIIWLFLGYLELSDKWNNNDRKRNLNDLKGDIEYDEKIDEIIGKE